MGGPGLESAGLEVLHSASEIAVVGISEAVKILPRARRIFRHLLEEVERRGVRYAVLVDAPDFNLRLAKALHARGVRVVYYVSPQIWAWRRGRVDAIRRVVDRMLVLFPFEVDFYREHGVDVELVGHPLIDEVPELPQAWDRSEPTERFRVALLPGSRRSEMESLAPTLLEAARRLAESFPITCSWVMAPGLPEERVRHLIAAAGLPVSVVPGNTDRFATIAESHLALCASGTATLEVGLLGTPLVVVYRVSSWTHMLGRLMVRLPNISLVNLVLGRRAVPELIQSDATPARIADESERLLRDAERREAMRRDLAELRDLLGAGGASERAAAAVLDVMEATA
jgi:lipid-A-disaccharide synthase